jgi:hypothetical protein
MNQALNTQQKPALPKPIKRDGKYSIDDAVYILWNGRMQWVLAMEGGLYHISQSRIALAKGIEKLNEDVSRNNAEVEFRMEVVDAMVRKGIAKHVALNRTANHPGLMAAAREYRVI